MEELVFKKCKPVPERLLAYGFLKTERGFRYQKPVLDGQFTFEAEVAPDGKLRARLWDGASGGEYVLHLVPACEGAFVGEVRESYRAEIDRIREACFESEYFRYSQTAALVKYIREQYGAAPEYLWEDENFIFRRADNQKWFAAVLPVKRGKLAIEGEGVAEIVNLRVEPSKTAELIDGERYFPAYHMNKKNWISVLLDGSVPEAELFMRVDESYRLVKK